MNREKSSPSMSAVRNVSGHIFKKVYFKKFTWCALCGDFVWGVSEPQGYQCQVHKKCLKEADSMTSCNEMMTKKGSKKVKDLKADKLLDRLAALEQQIEDDVILEPFRVESYLTLIQNIDDELLADYKFDIFKKKMIQDSVPPGPHPPLQHCSHDDLRWDVLACLLGWITKASEEKAQICALFVLDALLHEDTNKTKFLVRRHAHELTKLLTPFEVDKPPKTFRIYQLLMSCFAESAFWAEQPSDSMPQREIAKKDHELKLLYMEHVPGDVGNRALGNIINFLHKLSKVKIRQAPPFKETFKEERLYVAQALMDGARMLAMFYTHSDKSFLRYVDSKKGLALVLAGANAGLVNLHREILPTQVLYGQILYDSILCTVYEGEFEGIPVAIKAFNPKGLGFTWENFRKEISLLASVQHPNVCELFGACTNKDIDKPFLVMDLFTRGSIKDLTQKDEFTQQETRRATRAKTLGKIYAPKPVFRADTGLIVNLAMNAANGIAHLHSKFIVHRDIKPGNFLVDEHYNAYVIDFGVSRVSAPDPRDKMTLIGTPNYMAPEVLDNKPYDDKVDTYSFALVLWSMIAGREPFEGVDPFNLADEVVNKKLRPKIPPKTHPGLAYLIERGWDANPNVRPTFEEILSVLYNIQDPITRRFYCRIWENVPDDIFATRIISHLDRRSFLSFGVTSKRFFGLCKSHRAIVEPSDALSIRAPNSFTNPSLNTNRKIHAQTVGASSSQSKWTMGDRGRTATSSSPNTLTVPTLGVPTPTSGDDSITGQTSERRTSWLKKSPRNKSTDDPIGKFATQQLQADLTQSEKSPRKSPRLALSPRSVADPGNPQLNTQ